ncbi:MAG: pyruvate dehydrogenase (acetyl-transferring), homodimeric type [Myxococcota bacterium]
MERGPDEREAERRRMRDWMASLDDVLSQDGVGAAERLLAQLHRRAAARGARPPDGLHTPYVNTIPTSEQPAFEGDLEMERRIEALVRWNAMAMVVRANRRLPGIGGHIASFASAATLFEVGFNHFFHGRKHPQGGDQVYLQGHAATGVYARAFLEGRLDEAKLDAFRRELVPGGGLSSYPHPWLMPDFWEHPTVSMGLSPVMAIYQARFNRYLENRGLIENAPRVWAVIGDGEMDEPEAAGALHVAAQEGLGNLTFAVDCNLQRLDGPVRGSGKLIQQLEGLFRGAGWHVIKVLWSSDWDPLLERDLDGRLVQRMDETVDGDWQKYAVEGGAHMREHLFEPEPHLAEMVRGMSDAELGSLRRGGHDIEKVWAAYRAAEQETERPTVILAQTVKGYGLGEAGEAQNVAHKTKTLDAEHLRRFRDRLGVPVPDEGIEEAPYYRPADDGDLVRYLRDRREALGGPLPARQVTAPPLDPPHDALFDPYMEGSSGRPATTTMILVRLLADLAKDERLGPRVVPIVPDEARTFGVEAMFPQVGIYAPQGQLYEPVDEDALLTYREARNGQILEEGITEAGALSSLIAAGTAHASHGIAMVPFFFFYSMFGFQRVGDLLWAAGDTRARGFLIGATSGRTTLNGEGLQHQDGHSHLLALTHPRVKAFDPTFGYELATIVRDGLRRMFEEGEDWLYYITVSNEPYEHPARPDGVDEGILRGLYRHRAAGEAGDAGRARLLASGVMLHQALEAQRMLQEDFGVAAEVWSVTSWKELYTEALDADRFNRFRPGEPQRVPYVRRCLGDDDAPIVAVSDFVKALPGALARWLPAPIEPLGTDGFGRSDSRPALRDHFEVDARHVAWAALRALHRQDRFSKESLDRALQRLEIDPDKPNPRTA